MAENLTLTPPPATRLGTASRPGREPAALPEAPAKPDAAQRLYSLDAYRGLIMITLAFAGFGLAGTARAHLSHDDSTFWRAVWFQFDHADWVGGGYWDLIQPSFMFMVGAAMAYSYTKRQAQGQSFGAMLLHAAWRSVVLVFLGIFLISNGRDATDWSFMNVLTQIGLGYTFLFLLSRCPWPVQALAAVAILVGTWFLYMSYPTTGINLETGNAAVGVSAKFAQENLTGIDPHWHKNANVGHAIDMVLLNLWEPDYFRFNGGGYQTINFLPSLATMLFGLLCGELLRSGGSHRKKLIVLVVAGVVGVIAGHALDLTGVCPMVKRIWTPSWALWSTGCCCLILAGLYAVIDVMNYRRWAFFLVVVGMNSIAIYCMGQLLGSWTARTWQTHLGPLVQIASGHTNIYEIFGPDWMPLLRANVIGLTFWLVCLWMYRQKIFIRI